MDTPLQKNDKILVKKDQSLDHQLLTSSTYTLFRYSKTDSAITNTVIYRKLLIKLLTKCSDDTIKHVIDRCINLEESDSSGVRLIHYVCKYANPSIITYLVDKGINLECQMKSGHRPIHLVCERSTPDIIKYMVGRVDIECVTKEGHRPIHFVCRYSTIDMIQWFVDTTNCSLEAETNEGNRPIHFVCRRSDIISGFDSEKYKRRSDRMDDRMIKYIVSNGVNICAATVDGMTPLHLVCKHSSSNIIRYFIDLICERGSLDDLEAEDENNWRPIHYLCTRSIPEAIQYLIGLEVNIVAETYEGYQPIHMLCHYLEEDDMMELNKSGVDFKHMIDNMNDVGREKIMEVLRGYSICD